MRIIKFIPVVTIGAFLSTLVFCGNSNKIEGDENLLSAITELLSSRHYQPKKINDNFSQAVFKNYMDKIDNKKQFFTQKQMGKLKSKYAKNIDDEIKKGSSEFMDSTWSALNQRLYSLERVNKRILNTPIDFKNSQESITIETTPKKYPKNESVLENRWSKWVTWNVLDRLHRKIQAQKTDSARKKVPYDSLELKARTETKTYLNSWFKRLKEMDQRDKLSFYANAVSEVFDPHTSYFPPAQKDNFDIQMTGKLEGIGATLSQRDGYIKVERIVAGSASYKQGDLKAGYLIVKVAQADGDPVDVVDMKLDDAIKMIRGKKGTEVRLTVKKPDGKIQVIPIIRDVVIIEESYAKSAIINENDTKYGVIYLPSFYADFSQRGRGRNSANDVLIEIKKLKNAGVSGIILDLRNNGGGSLADAIEMGGHFISTGPIVQVRTSNNRIQAAQDRNPSVAYDGPLVILTNFYSASASEILAAAMQDYKRGIVIGSKTTYGKGTVQTFIPLEYTNSSVFKNGFGQMKVTIQKFYRINGKTTQLNGVVPDIIIPDLYDELDLGEKDMDYHLGFDEIAKARYSPYRDLSMNGRETAIHLANIRISKDAYFNQTIQKAKRLKSMRDSYSYTLNLKKYAAEQQKIKDEDKAFNITYTSADKSIDPLKVDVESAGGDEVKIAQKKDWIKMYANDATLDQAVFVLKDLNLQK
ncbi:MAG: carboxy terminal-processing peptidase [Bacteroidia bacterium]|nr:carboxy terminal-processing peptidase [Bacteroidia bacterium]